MKRLSLATGWPAPSLLPTSLVASAAQSALSDPKVAVPGMLYGPDEGYGPLRHELARWLSDFYQQCEPSGQDGNAGARQALTYDRFVITGGASQALACILQVFSDPVYTLDVLFVAPSYFMIYPTFVDNGFAGRLKAVPEEEEGLDLGRMRKVLEESERVEKERERREGSVKPLKPPRPYSKYYRHIIYCVPTFANPSSRTMSISRRTSLVRLAREFDALIISDDVYDFLQWPAHLSSPAISPSSSSPPLPPPLPRLSDIDRTLDLGPSRPNADGFGNTVSNGTFSKIVGPGVRCGWNEASPKLAYGISQCGSSTSGGAPSQLTSTYMAELVRVGALQSWIEKVLRPAYERRWRRLVGMVDKYLVPLGVTVPGSAVKAEEKEQGEGARGEVGKGEGKVEERDVKVEVAGGYFLWLELPEGVRAVEYAKRCLEVDVPILAGPRFAIPGDESCGFERNVRLCFSYIDEDLMEEAVGRISGVLEKMLREK